MCYPVPLVPGNVLSNWMDGNTSPAVDQEEISRGPPKSANTHTYVSNHRLWFLDQALCSFSKVES